MWNPKTSPSVASSSDNNQKKEAVDTDDCSCSEGIEHLNQQQERENSKTQTLSVDSQLTGFANINLEHKNYGSNKEGEEHRKLSDFVAETTDSGFISGPQTSDSAKLHTGSEEVDIACGDIKILNIASFSEAQQPNKEQTNFDSGIIEEEYSDGECNIEKQNNQSNQSKMILPHSVESGISEWFCNLSLQNNPNGNTVLSASNSNTNLGLTDAGSVLNNLDAPREQRSEMQEKTSSCAVGSIVPQHQQKHLTASMPQQINLSNAWEKYYQQNDDGDTSLHLACISGFEDVVIALIRMAPHPCLFNIQNDDAQTPLHLATLTAQPKIIRMLLIAGAKPTVRDRHGNTALHIACMSGEEQCVRALTIPISASEVNEAHRQYGYRANHKSHFKYTILPSDLEIRNYDGERCVHLAAQAGFINILRLLVLYGADINAREGKSGRTPLHIAIECCNEDLVSYLLDDCQTLNLETETYAGLTAYQVACTLNKSEMQNILQKRGAEPLTPPDSDYDSSDIETDLDDSKLYDRFGDPGYFVGYKGGNPMRVA